MVNKAKLGILAAVAAGVIALPSLVRSQKALVAAAQGKPKAAAEAVKKAVRRAGGSSKPAGRTRADGEIPPAPTNAAAPRLTEWKVLGPGGGGAQYRPVVSPHDPNFVLVASDMTGGYASEDGGNSWRQFNLRAVPKFFVFDPINPNVIYTGLGPPGTVRSTDRGRTWSQFDPPTSILDRIALLDDEAEAFIQTTRGYVEPFSALVIDPANSNILYGTAGNELKMTTDGGKNWTKISEITNGARYLFLDGNSPKDNRRLVAVGGTWIGSWENKKWTVVDKPNETPWIYDAAAGTPRDGGPMVVYLLFEEHKDKDKGPLVMTTDGGRTLRPFYKPLLDLRSADSPFPYFKSIGTGINNPDTVYVSYSRLRLPDTPDQLTHLGIAKTSDRGQTWSVVWKDTVKTDPNMDDPWVSEVFNTEWGDNPHSIGVHPTNPDIVYASDLGRTVRSTDGGATWKGVYSNRLSPLAWTTTGLDVLTCYGVHFDPFLAGSLLVSYTDIQLFRSDDRGATWRNSAKGIPRSWNNTTYWVEFDPQVKGRAWAAMGAVHDLPRVKMARRLNDKDVWSGGIAISDDHGETWRAATEGLPPNTMTHVLLDPTSPVEARVLYAVAYGTGVFKSTDGGESWALKKNGIASGKFGRIAAWRLHRDAAGVLYLIVARRGEDGQVGTLDDGALYRSTDGAETWQKVVIPTGVTGPTGINSDPRNPSRLYLTAHGRFIRYGWVPVQSGGLFISTDAGRTWKLTFDSDQYLYDTSYDPSNPDIMYMTGFSSSAWRSTDAGQRWTRIPGYNFKAGHRVIPDPFDKNMIYITTFGSSVWYGPATGSGGEQDEDIVPPGVPYGPSLSAVRSASAKTSKPPKKAEVARNQ